MISRKGVREHTCIRPGCNNPAAAGRLCPMHYRRKRKMRIAKMNGRLRLYVATNLREISEIEAVKLFSAGRQNLGRLIRGEEIKL